jgi:hypothetical protein
MALQRCSAIAGSSGFQQADNLVDTITGNLPRNTTTAQAVEQLMDIFKVQAKKATCEARTARILQEQAQAQRVFANAQRVTTKEKQRQEITPTEIPNLEIEEIPNYNNNRNRGAPMILQDNNNGDDYIQPSAANMHQQQQTRTLTQEHMQNMMELPGTKTAPFNPQQAASQKYPLQFLCNFANAVLDDETGDLLEYRHLIKHPKYKATWSKFFGTEIRCLATTTKTIFFCRQEGNITRQTARHHIRPHLLQLL